MLRVLHHPKDAVPQNTKPGRSRNRKQGRADDEGKVIPVHSRPYLQANAFQTISASKCISDHICKQMHFRPYLQANAFQTISASKCISDHICKQMPTPARAFSTPKKIHSLVVTPPVELRLTLNQRSRHRLPPNREKERKREGKEEGETEKILLHPILSTCC